MAEFRIDQATPGAGTPGVARHDLVPGEVITLVATSPIGPGVTYSWEILDKVGSPAVLSSPTGASVTIGPNSDVTQPCAFRIRLTADDNGIVTTQTRIASVRTANAQLRIPLFAESAPAASTLAANDPSASDDNAVYTNRAGLGSSAQNWRGWAEWAYELTLYLDTVSGSAVGGDLDGSLPNPTVVGLQGVDIHNAAPNDGDVLTYSLANTRWEAAPPTGGGGGGGTVFTYQPGGTPGGNVYDDWATLYAAASPLGRGVTVILDGQFGACVIPPGTWAVDGWTFTGRVGPDAWTVNREALLFDDGCVLTCLHLRLVNVNIDTWSTAPVIDLTSPGVLAARFELEYSFIRGASSSLPLIVGGTTTEFHVKNSDIGTWTFRAGSAAAAANKDLNVFIHGVSTISDRAFSDNGYSGPPEWRLFLHYFTSSPGYDSGELAGVLQSSSGPWTGWNPANVTARTYTPTRNEPILGDVMTWSGSEWLASAPTGGGGGAADFTLATNTVVTTLDTEVVIGGGLLDFGPVLVPTLYATGYAVTAGTVEIRLYALNISGPGPDDLRSTITLGGGGSIAFATATLTPVPAPSLPDEVLEGFDAYEIRVHIAGGSPGDVVHVLNAGVRVN